MRISKEEMDRRGRMIRLRSDLTDVIGKHAADKMTVAEIVAVLLELSRTYIGWELRDELGDDE